MLLLFPKISDNKPNLFKHLNLFCLCIDRENWFCVLPWISGNLFYMFPKWCNSTITMRYFLYFVMFSKAKKFISYMFFYLGLFCSENTKEYQKVAAYLDSLKTGTWWYSFKSLDNPQNLKFLFCTNF